MTVIYIIAAILVFGFLIAIHELGHFITAKAVGVRVNEYAIGMGPALLQKTAGETTYSLRAFPFGGYCAMEGDEENSDDPKALNNKSFWAKLAVYVAGSFMNFVAGLVIILLLYAGAQAFYTSRIVGFAEGCPLQSETGLQVGDRILSIDGERVYVFNDVGMLLGMNTDGTFDLIVDRDGHKVTLRDFPMERREYRDQQGGTYTGYGLFFGIENATVGSRLVTSWNSALDFVRMVRLSLKMLFTGQAGIKDLSGPVGIVNTMTEVGKQSASVSDALENILYIGALLAVNLAIMNLMPFPGLDGGKVLFLVLNTAAMALFKKQIPIKYENYIHLAGLVLVLLLMVVVTFSDVWKLIQR